ncbi:MAG: secretin N-terminal domain-containing protein [Planctomycetota bacterium]
MRRLLMSLGFALAAASGALAQEERGEGRYYAFQDAVDLRELMEHWVGAKSLNLQFDRELLEGTVTLRTTTGVGEETLWALTNRELVAKGLACIQAPGEENLSVVALDKAAALARIEEAPERAEAGYIRVLRYVKHAELSAAQAALRPLLEETGGKLTEIDASRRLLLAGLKPQVLQALEVLSRIDLREDPPVVFEVAVQHASPVAVKTSLEQAVAARSKISGELKGTVLPLVEKGTLLLLAPPVEVPEWQALIERFDHVRRAETRHYVPLRFGLRDTAQLLESTVGASSRTAGEPGWQVVEDELTGVLIVTATPATHAEVERALERLDGAPTEARSGMRSIPVRHRAVEEVLALLEQMLDAGNLPTAPERPEEERTASPPEGGTGGPADAFRWQDRLTLSADPAVNRILAVGETRLLDQIETIVGELDTHFPQVLIEALVLALTEGEAFDLGVELQKLGSQGDASVQLASLFGLGSPDPAGGLIPPAGGAGFSGVVLDPGEFSAVVRALEVLNQGRSLTVPRVLVNNNQDATLASVVQTPYLATNASDTVATTSFGGTLDAGTTVSVQPQIADGDRLILDYQVSLSSFVGESTDPAVPPPRQENTLQSVVTIPDGHTVVLGGLEITTESDADSQVPLLGSIPGLGRLFRSSSTSRNRSRFFVFLRCTVMRSEGFEELKYASRRDLSEAELEDGWPVLEPLVIR